MLKKILLGFVCINSASFALEASVSKTQLVSNLIATANIMLNQTSQDKINQKSACLGINPSQLPDLTVKVEKIITKCTANLPEKVDMADQVLRKGFISCAKKEAANSLGVTSAKLKQCF